MVASTSFTDVDAVVVVSTAVAAVVVVVVDVPNVNVQEEGAVGAVGAVGAAVELPTVLLPKTNPPDTLSTLADVGALLIWLW